MGFSQGQPVGIHNQVGNRKACQVESVNLAGLCLEAVEPENYGDREEYRPCLGKKTWHLPF